MAVISVPSSATGATYSVRIAGDTPTAAEQARIDAYVAQMDATMAPVTPTAPEDTGPDTSFTGALRYAFDQPLENMAVTSKALGGEGIASFLSGLTDAPSGYEPAMEGFINEGGSLFDFSYLPRAAVEQAGQVVGQIGTRAAGALLGGAAGSVVPVVGTATGAAAGAFAGPALFEGLQVLGPVALKRAENNGRDEPNAEDWLGALSTAGMSGALNAIAPGLSGFVRKTIAEAGTEGLQSIVQQAGETAATDVGLEIDPRQAAAEAILGGTAAGAITAPFAIAESRSAKRDAAKKADERALSDLEEDQKEEAEDAAKRIEFGDASVAPPPVEEATVPEAEAPAALLPAPTTAAPSAPESLVTPDESLVTPEAPRPAQPFRWRDYTAATQAVVNAKDASVPAIQKAASADPKKPAPPAVAKAIRDRMVADGVIVADKKSKGGFRVVPTRVPDVDQTESYRRTLDDLQQDAQDATAAQQKALVDARRAEQTGSKADARKFNLQADAAAETLSRIQATRQEVEARLPRATAEVSVPRTEAPLSPVAGGRAAVPITEAPARAQATAVSDRAKRLTQSLRYYQGEAARKAAEVRRLREAGKKVQLPKSDQQRIIDLEQQAASDARTVQQIRAQLARPAADIEQDRTQKAAAAAKEASVAAEAAARTPTYTAKEGQLFTALRRRLDNLGLSDVKLVAERVIRPAGAPQNALVEGMMDVDARNGNRIIALALGVYDPKMTQQELFDSISAVMNHEVIHAIRSLGLFTDGEWKTLSDLAARQRYMKAKNGKTVERSYTYLQRAQQMYADATPEIQSEEAVAEMFRDYVAGRLKIGGKPKTLMDRIKGFFKALWGSHAEAGLTDPNAIFEGVRFGDIGKRERKAAAPVEGEARLSRAAARDAFLAGNHPDVPDVLYHGNAPRVVENQKYLGDGKWDSEIDQDATSRNIAAQDFSEFKPSRYGNYGPGIYLSDSPKTASGYAQGIRADQPETKPYGQVMKLNVSMKQPFTDDTLRIPAWKDYIKSALTQYSIPYDEDRNARDAILKALDNGTATVRDLFLRETPQGTMVNQHGQHDIHDVIRNSGFDGIIAGRPDGSKEYVAFKPEQVKSALSASRFDSTSPDMRMSRIAAERAPSDPNYVKWSNGPNGERAVVNANGTPVVYYTGTSKDQDFTSFKVGRHGGWFTTDPSIASEYAAQNDSQGFTRDGWSMVPTNTKSRVMPVFLRAANPFTGPLPQSAYAENYKRAQSDWFDTLRRQGYDAWIPADQPGLAVILRDGTQVKSAFARGTGGKADMRRYSRLIATDNPGGSWLEGKRRRAEEDMRTAAPGSSSSKGVTGSITAYMPKPVNMPVDILSSLTGANDEVRRPGDARYDELAADVARRGFVPDQDGNAVVVGVNHLGQAYLKEGNTRVAVARDFGVPSVRAEVRWFNGGELADGPFSPAAVERLAASATDPSSPAINEDTQRRLSVLRTKNRSTDLVRGIDELVQYAEEQSSWRDWYDRYQSVLSDLFGDSSDLFRSLLSATSQAASVPANVGLAIKAYDQMLSGQPFTGFLPAVIKNLNRIRADEALSGRKIGEYGKANEGDDQGIAIDRHIAMIMFDTVNPSAGQVEAGKAAIRTIAERLGWRPREVQAALWAANIKRTGKEPQSYDTFLIRKAEQIRAIRERFPTSVDRRDGQGAGAGRGADVGAAEDGQRFSILRGAVSQPDTTVAGGLTSKGYIKVSDLERAMITPIFADLTSAGNVYDQLDGMAVAPTTYMGGPNFPWLKAYRDANVVWAFNDKAKITALRNKVLELRRLGLEQGGDGRVVVTVLAMKDDAHTSNEMSISSLINTLNAVVASGKFPQSQLDTAKEMITSKAGKRDEGYSGLVSFPGFDDASALADWSRKASFTTRKALATEMQSAAFQSLEGMFPVSRVVREAVDPDYRATQQGDMLLAFEIDPNDPNLVIDFQKYHTRGDRKPYGRYKGADGKTYRVPRHPAYQFGLRGKLLGSFNTHIPMEVMYGDLLSSTYNRIPENLDREQEAAKKKADRSGEPFTPMTPEEREKAIAAKQRNWTPKFALERSRTTDGQLVTQQVVKEAEAVEGLHDYRVAQAMLAGIAGRWRSSDNAAVSGGIQPVEFERALAENEAAATLTKYTRADVQQGQKDGSLRVFQLGSVPVKDGGLNVWMGVQRGADYRNIYPSDLTDRLIAEGVLSDNEVALVGVANNELGVSGMTTFQVLKGIEEGVTVLDAFKVKSASKPYGLLPSIYGTLGFEEVGEIPFDPQYYTPQQIDDLKAVWSRQGWLEEDGMPSVSIMKWRGDDAARSEASKRFVLEGQDGLGIRGEPDLGQFDAERASVFDSDAAGDQGDGLTGQGDGRANPRRFADRARDVSGRARDFVQNVLKADDSAIKALKLPRDLIEKIKADYGQDQSAADVVTSPDARMSIRYAVSPITANVRQNIQANQKALMYARSSDLIARILTGTKLVKKDTAREFADGLLRRFQDSMLPIGRMVQELSAKGMTITDAMDPYLQEELMHGVVGDKISANQKGLYEPVVQAIKKLNVPKARIDQLIAASNAASTSGKGYVALAMEQSDSPRMVLADAYLYAKHARERNRYIKANKDKTNDSGSGMTDAEADAIVQWFNTLDPANAQALKDMAKGIRLIVANTNQTRVDGGLIAEDAVDKDGNTVVLGSQYKFYVPLRGVTDGDVDTNEDDFTGPPGTPRYGARGREDRRALGRYDYAADLVANVFTQNQNAILRAERNKVGQSLLKLLRADPNKTTAYAEVLKRAPTMRASVDGTMRDVPDPRAYNDPDILVVKEDGKEVFVRFRDERVAGAMNGKNGLSPTTGASLTSAMQKVNRYLANINTSYNPEFFITNMFRDLSTAGVNINQFEMEGLTADAIKNVKSALVGIKRVIRNEDDTSEWSKVYKDFVASGGQNATNQFNTLSDEMSNIQGILGDISESGIRGKWASVKNSFIGQKTGSLLSLVENYNTIVENGIRVATYKALIDRGMSKQRAAQAARNVTVNFAKGGDYRQFMGAWYLFYNASLQGSFALLNAAVRSPKVRKVWAGIMVAGLLQDQLNALLSDEDEDGQKIYDKIPKHVLEHNFILPDVFGITDRSYISIPMPYGLNMAHNLGRAVSRAARGEYDAGEATSTIFGTIADTLNPIGGAESWANFVAPTVADPFIDILENEDFADKPIYKEGLPFDRTPAPASQLYWSTTSPSAVWITNNLNAITGGNEVRPGFVDWSPDVVDFWFEFATGGVGRFVQRIAELPFKDTSEGLSDEIVRDIPFFRKLVGSVSEREDMGAYIEGAKAVLTAGDELKRAREVGDAAWARETIQRYGKELRLVGPIKSLEGALRETSKMRNQINANTNIPDEQKKVLLDRIEERRQMILSRANSLLRNAGL